MQDFQSALKIMPHDKNILTEISSLKERMQSYLAIEKVVYEKMLKWSYANHMCTLYGC